MLHLLCIGLHQFVILCYAQLLTAEEEALLGTLAQMKQDLEHAVRCATAFVGFQIMLNGRKRS